MGVFGLTSFMVARRETAGQHYQLHDLPDGAAGVVVVDALAILHWLLKVTNLLVPSTVQQLSVHCAGPA